MEPTVNEDPAPAPTFPNLDDVVQSGDVSQKGGSGFKADYVNWARISHYLRVHAPGWQPFMERDREGKPYHLAPDGSVYLLIGFRHLDINIPDTEVVVHAIMDARNNAKKENGVDARDISDAFVRGMCKAAALLFGLGWKLWSKDDPMSRNDDKPKPRAKPKATPKPAAQPKAEPTKRARQSNETKGGNTVTVGSGEPSVIGDAKEGDIWIDAAEVPARVLRYDGGGEFDPLMESDAPYTSAHETLARMVTDQAMVDNVSTTTLMEQLQEADGADAPATRFSDVSVSALAQVYLCPL